MGRLVPISAVRLIKILRVLGFVETHRKGSHRFFFHPITKKTATVPDHGSEDISIGTLKNILKGIELNTDQFEELRRQR